MAPRGLTPDEARLQSRFVRLAPQRNALELALEPFRDEQGEFSLELFAEAFESDDPQDILRVTGATSLYEGLVNHLNEMLQISAKLRGLSIARQADDPANPRLIDAVVEDGGLTGAQGRRLKAFNHLRNQLQHSSPGVEAKDVHEGISALLRTLGSLAGSYVKWLREHDIDPLRRSS